MSRLPDFFLIGAAKSGTSALFELICRHPRVFGPEIKEPMYFDLGGEPSQFTGPGDDEGINRRSVWRRRDYEALYAEAGGRLAGDGSTRYLGSARAPAAIHAEVPAAKLIAILRDPVERAHSAYTHLRRDGLEELADFGAALAAEPDRIARGYSPMWHYRAKGLYGRQLAPYLELFDRERLLLLRYEDFVRAPEAVIDAVWRFLELPAPADAGPARRLNPGGEVRSKRVRSLLIGDNRAKRAARRLLPARTRQRIWRAMMAGNVQPARAQIDPGVERGLRCSFHPEIEQVEEITGWDLSSWRAAAD